MGYLKKTYILRHGIQSEEYFSLGLHSKGEKRSCRKAQTPEKVKENNQRMKKDKIQRLMLEYFDPGDKYITLTYSDDKAPDNIGKVQQDMKMLIAHIKPYYAGTGTQIRWIRNIERTKRGIFHVHILLKNPPGTDIGKEVREYWKKRHGKIAKSEDTYMDGAFGALAAYMAKTAREDGQIVSSYSHSRGMKDVPPKRKEYRRWKARSRGRWLDIKVPKGYELVKESVYEGISEITGYPFRRYVLLKQEILRC